MSRRGRVAIAAVFAAVVSLPGLLDTISDGHDSYPLSSYPMFAKVRPTTTDLVGAVVVDADGQERRLSPQDVSGSPEPLQATAIVRSALGGDTDELCRAIAGRIGRLEPGEQLLLVRDRIDAVAHYADRDPAPPERITELDCPRHGG